MWLCKYPQGAEVRVEDNTGDYGGVIIDRLNDDALIIAMIETLEGTAEADSIATVEG